jgi:hypothetical protein
VFGQGELISPGLLHDTIPKALISDLAFFYGENPLEWGEGEHEAGGPPGGTWISDSEPLRVVGVSI